MIHFIFYVQDQAASTAFFAYVLDQSPSLNQPGMTEFTLGSACILGLMPEAGIRRLLPDTLPPTSSIPGMLRGELYMVVPDPQAYHDRALEKGATELSPLSARDWGDDVAYSLDGDGHVLAFARRTNATH